MRPLMNTGRDNKEAVMSDQKDASGVSRRRFLEGLAVAGGGLALNQALHLFGEERAHAQDLSSGPGMLKVPEGHGGGRKVVILGAGVSGLTTAFELLRPGSGYQVTVLEANAKVGGRSLTLRPGDVLREDGWPPQRCTFQSEPGEPFAPYLNAGPGRIPSAHIHLLHYCKQLAVELEVYVMQSRSNLVFQEGSFGDQTQVDRHLASDVRGYISECLYKVVDGCVPEAQRDALRSLLATFGMLDDHGRYVVTEDGKRVYANFGLADGGMARPGYRKLPGVEEGVPVEPLDFGEILESKFWEGTRFYQPQDFPWQPTLFQPVGGMDRIVQAFNREVTRRGGTVLLEAVVRHIGKRDGKFVVRYDTPSGPREEIADVCVSNIPIPLLQPSLDLSIFNDAYRESLQAVFGSEGFLAPTCKVGWQAERKLWQSHTEKRVVPIFGGISWTSHSMTQLWYPSEQYHARLGVLTGAYNFGDNAIEYGDHPPEWRLREAREGAAQLAGVEFAQGLGHGISIAWQNMRYERGGWANWTVVPDGVEHYNTLLKGDNDFFICGDQLSVLPGWQEGAVASALHVLRKVIDDTYRHVPIRRVPDPRLVVEGHLGPRGTRRLRQPNR